MNKFWSQQLIMSLSCVYVNRVPVCPHDNVGGSPSRPGSGHHWAHGQSVAKGMRAPGTACTLEPQPEPTAPAQVWQSWNRTGVREPLPRGGLCSSPRKRLSSSSLTHHESVMLHDVTGDVTFIVASPGFFTPVTRFQCEPALRVPGLWAHVTPWAFHADQ